MSIAFSPQRIGNVIVRNRFFRPPHQVRMCVEGRVTDRFLAYHEARAAGGAGLLIIDAAPVHPSSFSTADLLTIWDDEAIEGLKALKRRVLPYDTRLFLQIYHSGHNARPRDGSPPWSSSCTTGNPGIPAQAMTRAMIDELVASFAAAARRAAAAGLDGVEIHAAHGYLFPQFLAEGLNSRTDEYGGTLENRARFLIEVVRAVRKSVPEGFVVGVRLGIDVMPGKGEIPGLVSLDTIKFVIARLEDEGLIDYVHMSTNLRDLVAAGMQEPSGYEVPLHGDLAQTIGVPLLVTGRFRTADEVAQVIREGSAAMVGMVRAQIADPDVVRKSAEGREDEIRPCIACNQVCVAGHALGNFGCAVNPNVGREAEAANDLAKVSTPRQIAVIGGGVAGMEAARVAAERGHHVRLYEAQSDLGGKVRYVSKRAPKMGAFGDIAYWQESELRRLGVEIHTSSYVEASDLLEDRAEAVIVATGAVPVLSGTQRLRPGYRIDGFNRPHVQTSIEVLATAKEKLGRHALVFDDIGHYEAIAAGNILSKQG